MRTEPSRPPANRSARLSETAVDRAGFKPKTFLLRTTKREPDPLQHGPMTGPAEDLNRTCGGKVTNPTAIH